MQTTCFRRKNRKRDICFLFVFTNEPFKSISVPALLFGWYSYPSPGKLACLSVLNLLADHDPAFFYGTIDEGKIGRLPTSQRQKSVETEINLPVKSRSASVRSTGSTWKFSKTSYTVTQTKFGIEASNCSGLNCLSCDGNFTAYSAHSEQLSLLALIPGVMDAHHKHMTDVNKTASKILTKRAGSHMKWNMRDFPYTWLCNIQENIWLSSTLQWRCRCFCLCRLVTSKRWGNEISIFELSSYCALLHCAVQCLCVQSVNTSEWKYTMNDYRDPHADNQLLITPLRKYK